MYTETDFIENNPKSLKDVKTIVVHDGPAHADDLLVAALIVNVKAKTLDIDLSNTKSFEDQLKETDIEIIRTRDSDIIQTYQQNDTAIVADVGFGKFDHHGDDVPTFKDFNIECEDPSVKRAAIGLVVENYKDEIINIAKPKDIDGFVKELNKALYQIEIHDNMGPKYKNILDNALFAFRKPWDAPKISFDKSFLEEGKFVSDVINDIFDNGINHVAEFISSNDEIERLKLEIQESIERGNSIIKALADEQCSSLNSVLHIENADLASACIEGLSDHEYAKFVVFPGTNQAVLRAVPPVGDSSAQKIQIPQTIKEKIPSDKAFVHAAGFMAAFPCSEEHKMDECVKTLISITHELAGDEPEINVLKNIKSAFEIQAEEIEFANKNINESEKKYK